MSEKVVVVGQGYVGLPLALRAAEVGYNVVGYDLDEHRIKQLELNISYVEDVDSARLVRVSAAGRFQPTSLIDDIANFDLCIIAVPTPLRDGAPDLTSIRESAKAISGYLRPGCTVVLESTTYPGTTDELLSQILSTGSGLSIPEDVYLGYSPERIDPGNPTWTLVNTPKVVSGVDGPSLERVCSFYDRLVEQTVRVSSTRTAELSKLLENTFRHVNIALVNELATVAPDLHVDVWEAIEAAATKPFGFMRFTPGPGVGGHCLPTDPTYLSWQTRRTSGRALRFVELANEVNDSMPAHVVHRVSHGLNARGLPINGSRVLLLGLSYKANIGDVRESPALKIARHLCDLGANVRAADMHVPMRSVPSDVAIVTATASEVSWADAVIVLCEHNDFDFSMVAKTASYVFDTRNCCFGDNVERI
jgi:nucleotide sugar dehydrogenase